MTHASPSQPPVSFAHLTVRSAPRIDDPRELQTILITSLRALWGDLETHSFRVVVSRTLGFPPEHGRAREGSSGDTENAEEAGDLLFVKCPVESVPAVRAALTVVTPPPYLEDTVYCLDVVSIREETGGE